MAHDKRDAVSETKGPKVEVKSTVAAFPLAGLKQSEIKRDLIICVNKLCHTTLPPLS